MLTETRAHDNGAAAGPGPGSSAGFHRGIVSDRSVLEMSVAERTRLVHHVHERWEKIAHAVPHVKQTYNWDCGLACVLMVVRALGASAHHCDLRTLRQLCRTTSIWTVDLAYLLRRFGADVTFTTVTMGANPAYESESFYRDNLREDCERVDALFEGARANGISIERKSLSLDAIKAYAGGGEYLVILLVDKPKLGVKPRDAMVLPEPCENERGRRGSDVKLGWLTGAAGKPAAWGARDLRSGDRIGVGVDVRERYGSFARVHRALHRGVRLQSRGRRVPVQGPGVARQGSDHHGGEPGKGSTRFRHRRGHPAGQKRGAGPAQGARGVEGG